MTLQWHTCPICNGCGEFNIMKSRTHIIKDNEKLPLVDDTQEKCLYCKGTGHVYTKTLPFNPWTLYRKTDNEQMEE